MELILFAYGALVIGGAAIVTVTCAVLSSSRCRTSRSFWAMSLAFAVAVPLLSFEFWPEPISSRTDVFGLVINYGAGHANFNLLCLAGSVSALATNASGRARLLSSASWGFVTLLIVRELYPIYLASA